MQHALDGQEKAYEKFFAKRADFLKYKRKRSGNSIRHPGPKHTKFDEATDGTFSRMLSWLHYQSSLDVLSEGRNVVQTQFKFEQPFSIAVRATGVDFGVARFATMSNGNLIAPLNSFKKH